MVRMQKHCVYGCWFFFFPQYMHSFNKFRSEGWKLHLFFLLIYMYTTWVKNLENNTENNKEQSLTTGKHRVLNENSTDVVLTASSILPKAGFVHRHFPKALGQLHEQHFPHPLEAAWSALSCCGSLRTSRTPHLPQHWNRLKNCLSDLVPLQFEACKQSLTPNASRDAKLTRRKDKFGFQAEVRFLSAAGI